MTTQAHEPPAAGTPAAGDDAPECVCCDRPIPPGVDRVLTLDGDGWICAPCLWDGFAPGWREHEGHAEPYGTCKACGYYPGREQVEEWRGWPALGG